MFKGKLSATSYESINSGKGFVFAIATGVLLFFLIRNKSRQLILNQNEYRELHEANPTPMWIYDPITLKFISVNQKAIDVYGYTQDEFLSMTIKDIKPVEYHENLITTIINEDRSAKTSIWIHSKKDGTQLYVDLSASPITFKGKRAIMVLARDNSSEIAQQQLLEKANLDLANEKKRLTDIQELSKIAGWDYFIDSRGLVVSDEIYNIFNVDKDKAHIDYQYFLKAIHHDDLNIFLNAARQTIENNINMDIIHRLYFGKNNIRYVHELGKLEFLNGKPYKVRGTMQDITEWKLMEFENYNISNENKKLDNIITRINNMVVILDTESRITWVNKAFENFTGYTLSEIEGLKPSSFMTKPEAEEQIAEIDKAQNQLEAFSVDLINYTKQNIPYWVNIEFTPLFNGDEFAGYITVHNNITSRKEKEEEVTKQNIILRDIAWLSSHEIRRSVASILGLLDLINTTEDHAEKEEYLALLNECTLQMDRVIHHINRTIHEKIPNVQ